MDPDTRSQGGDLPDQPQGGVHPSRVSVPTPEERDAQRAAAANVIRQRIENIYGEEAQTPQAPVQHQHPAPMTSGIPQANSPTPAHIQQQALHSENPYQRTHTSHHPQASDDQWKAYHTAWQQYYQKYYEQFYSHQHKNQKQAFIGSRDSNHTKDAEQEAAEQTVSRDDALYELRQQLVGRVQTSAKKIRRSRHFVPIVASIVVVLLFLFLQYNRVLFANVQAYVSPGSLDPQNIVIDPTAEVEVGPQPRLIIPKINVDVPVMYDVGTDNASQMKAMENGVAHFPIPGANSHPGEIGNTAIAGHSSNDLFDQGDYKFIFAQLEKLKPGDTIYANYEGKRYTYVVTKLETVKPTQVDKLVYPTDKPVMTLITCTPLGTALNRLLVTAEQVSPDPTEAAAAPTSNSTESTALPGNSPTLLERLFGAN